MVSCRAKKKVAAIRDLPPPSNKKETKSFIGLATYFRHSIPDFARTLIPLYLLTKSSTKFVWTHEEQQAFQKMKAALCSPPCLAYPQFNKPFIITTDASGYAIGAILSQIHEDGEKAVRYLSRKLQPAEMNYASVEREMLAIVYALQEFYQYVKGRDLTIVTDCNALIYSTRMTDPSSRLMRWNLQLQEYNPKIVYRKGIQNTAADALSRSPQLHDRINRFTNQTKHIAALRCVEPERMEKWRKNACEELGLTFTITTEPLNQRMENEDDDSLFKQASLITTNSDADHKRFRELIHQHIHKNRKYYSDFILPDSTTDTEHLRNLKSGGAASEVELQALSSCLNIPIIYMRPNLAEQLILPESNASISRHPPFGAVAEIKRDNHKNFRWTNPTLTLAHRKEFSPNDIPVSQTQPHCKEANHTATNVLTHSKDNMDKGTAHNVISTIDTDPPLSPMIHHKMVKCQNKLNSNGTTNNLPEHYDDTLGSICTLFQDYTHKSIPPLMSITIQPEFPSCRATDLKSHTKRETILSQGASQIVYVQAPASPIPQIVPLMSIEFPTDVISHIQRSRQNKLE